MIFTIKTSPINGQKYMVFDSPYRDPWDYIGMLRDAFPNQGYCICCFGGYEDAISFEQQYFIRKE